jgi:hypothetical protein
MTVFFHTVNALRSFPAVIAIRVCDFPAVVQNQKNGLLLAERTLIRYNFSFPCANVGT